ncbi:hypothetical protein KFZ56_13180 [Virgibacillus sp. NKC19-3]|uniref:hypothetical protein n=1 Tax=Virgibacillus saliphilus TaxID=2831674 RepID=UPI001C9B8EB9|nr:hypothetical protein [Virgibacillus sp. NKC19-3]MBY7143979.1 hypothetical protein [Virgibacillus sp. NKC19-3]
MDEMFNDFMKDASKGEFPEINITSTMDQADVENGKGQAKIVDFLDKKNIKTKAFGQAN